MTANDTPTPTEYYDQLEPAIETVDSLQERAVYDGDLNTEERATVRRTLFTIKRTLQEAREILPDPDPATERSRPTSTTGTTRHSDSSNDVSPTCNS